MSKPTVFVASASGWVQHGPVRSSLGQAENVARSLVRRLGWVARVFDGVPVGECPPVGLPVALAGLSPVWKDPGLAAQWAASSRGAGPRAPRAAVPVPVVVPVASGSLSEELALVARAGAAGLVLR